MKSDSPARAARHAGVGTWAAGADDLQLVYVFDMDAVEAALIAHGMFGVGDAVGAFILSQELGEVLLREGLFQIIFTPAAIGPVEGSGANKES